MAQIALITTAGQAAIVSATFFGYKIDIVRYKISDTLITETDPALIRALTELPGTIVQDSGNNPIDGSLTYEVTGSQSIAITTILDASKGPYNIGCVGLYLADGTLFAILKLNTLFAKTINAGMVVGNTISFPFIFALTLLPVINLDILSQINASLPTVATEVDLPPFNLAPYNAYLVLNFAATGKDAIAIINAEGWQYIVASKQDTMEGYIKVASSSFESGIAEGDVVYLNYTTGKWTLLDGLDGTAQVIGIKNGGGVKTSSFYYKSNAYIAGTDYFANTSPDVGKLTSASSKWYIGTAVTNSIILVKPEYLDTSIVISEIPEFYYATADIANLITLTLTDSDLYPNEYQNGLRISFIAPIASVINQQIVVTGLTNKNITKLANIGSAVINIVANDFRAGELVEMTYISTDNGFRLRRGSSSTISTSSSKNALINGDMNIWQRGTSFTSMPTATYTADKWVYSKEITTAVHSITRSTDVPTITEAGRAYNYSLSVNCTTADVTLGANDLVVLNTNVEGYNFVDITQRTLTFSFWVKATKTGIYCISLSNTGNTRTYVDEYTVNASNTWEYKVIVLAPTPTSGTWDYTNGLGLGIGFTLMAGSARTGTKQVWTVGNIDATSNQVNAADNTSNIFRVTGVQLEAGDTATPFQGKTIQEETLLCQRYYEKSYDLETPPGTSTQVGLAVFNSTNTGAADNRGTYVPFKAQKRIAPSFRYWCQAGNITRVTLFDTSALPTHNILDNPGSTTLSTFGITKFTAPQSSFSGKFTVGYHWEVDSEIY